MKTLKEIQLESNQSLTERKEALRQHELFMKQINQKIAKFKRLEVLALANIDIEKIQMAEKILSCFGNPHHNCEGEILTDLAALDIAKGHPHLKSMFFGNKSYESFYQRCDCQYGYGPKHGSIVDRVEMSNESRNRELCDDEIEACIYYLKNYAKIKEALLTK